MSALRDYLAFQRWTATEVGRVAVGWAVSVAALLPIPILVKKLFDDAIPDGNLDLLLAIGLGLIVLPILSFTGTLIAKPVAIRKAWNTGSRIRDRIVTSIYRRSLTSLRSRSASDLHDLLVHETERVDLFGVALTSLVIPPIFLSVALFLLLLAINWWLSIVLLLVAPMLYFAGRVMSHRVWLRTVAHNETYRLVNEESLRLVESVELVHSRAAIDLERSNGRKRHRLLAVIGSKMRVLSQIYPAALQMLLAVTVSATLVIGGAAVINNAISLGDLFAFYAGLARSRPLMWCMGDTASASLSSF